MPFRSQAKPKDVTEWLGPAMVILPLLDTKALAISDFHTEIKIMASLNRVLIMGNLGQDPELRHTQSGIPVCTLNVATNEVRTDKDGNRQEQTEWHRVVIFNKQAENCAKYLGKGRPVFIEGKLQTRSWDDKATGQKRYMTEILANNVQFMGSGAAAGAGATGRDMGQGGQSPYQGSQGGSYSPPAQDPMDQSYGGPSTPSLDDIPF